jgi:hypothetical protein
MRINSPALAPDFEVTDILRPALLPERLTWQTGDAQFFP